MSRTLALAAGLALLSGCSVGKDLPLANAAIANFHQTLNAGDFAAIYDQSSPEMKASSTEAVLDQLLSAIHRKLGDFQSGSSVGWNDNVNTSGHFVTINYNAKYAGGAAQESFVYRIDGEVARLAGYHINSMALIVN